MQSAFKVTNQMRDELRAPGTQNTTRQTQTQQQMNILQKHTEETVEMQGKRKIRIVAVAPSTWRSKRDIRAKPRTSSCTLNGDLESKIKHCRHY